MISLSTKRTVIKFALIVILGASAIYTVRATTDFAKVKIMTGHTKKICVGRTTIDVPVEVSVSYRSALINGWFIATAEESEASFLSNLKSKEQELSAEKNEKGLQSLEFARAIQTDVLKGKVFQYRREWVHGYEGEKRIDVTFASVLAYVHGSGTSFMITAESGDDRVAELIRIIRSINIRGEEEIPTAPGFCIARAVVDFATENHTESVAAFFSFAEHPDFGVALESTFGLKPDAPLLSRANRSPINFGNRRLIIRSTDRAVNGFSGQELVKKYFELNGATTHNFRWESFSDAGDIRKPALTFELSTGIAPRAGAKPVSASLTDPALFSLWDSMLDSIQLRKTSTRP